MKIRVEVGFDNGMVRTFVATDSYRTDDGIKFKLENGAILVYLSKISYIEQEHIDN